VPTHGACTLRRPDRQSRGGTILAQPCRAELPASPAFRRQPHRSCVAPCDRRGEICGRFV